MVATVKWSEFPAGSSVSGANISVGLQGGDNVQWTMSQLATYFASAIPLTIGTTAISGGTTTRILYDNAGVLGEYTLTGSGTVVAMQTAPTFATSITTPAVLATANDSGALGASGTAFSDLFLANGGVIDFASGDITITQSTNKLSFAGASGDNGYSIDAPISATLTQGQRTQYFLTSGIEALGPPFTQVYNYAHITDGAGTYYDHVFQLGWNMASGGGRVISTEPSLGIQWESKFRQSALDAFGSEFHVRMQDTGGTERRPISIFAPHDGAAASSASMTLQSSAYNFQNWSGTALASYNTSNGWEWESGIKFNYNNTAAIQQRNAALDAFLDLPYYNNENSLIMAGPFRTSGGINATTNAYFDASIIMAANKSMLTMSGANSVTGAMFGTTIQGASTDDFDNLLQQNGNGNAINVVRVLGTGDPFTRFEVNGVTSWAVGLDNSASDAFKISYDTGSGGLGTNDRLTITTAGTVSHGPLAITGAVGSSAITITGATQTSSFPLIDATQTWNDSGVTFTGWKLNVTNTASAAASLLMDLQVGGVSKFYVVKDGNVTIGGGLTAPGNSNFGGGTFYVTSSGLVQVWNDSALAWSSTSLATGTADLKLFRDAANTLAQRNGTSAQTFRVYNTYTDGSNYERANIGVITTNVFGIGVEAAGSGTTTRALRFGTVGAGQIQFATNNSLQWFIDGSTGAFAAWADNATDIGGSGASRPRTAYLGTSLISPLSTVNKRGTPANSQTIATGVITTTSGYCVVDTEGAGATDDLDTINGGVDGMILVINAANGARDVVVKDGTGNIQCAGDCTLDNIQDTITLLYSSTQSAWLELCRSNNGA